MSYEELSINGFIQEIKDVSDGHHPENFVLFSAPVHPYHPE